MADRIVVNVTPPPDLRRAHPCVHGHRWAYLARGGVACGVCGVRRG